jgi:hypothetical protein
MSFQSGGADAAISCLCFFAYFVCHACFTAHQATDLQRSSVALSGYSESSVAAVVVSDTFGVMTAGGLVSAIVAGAAELVVARFSCWRHFFAAFFEIPDIVSMVTKNGKPPQCSETKAENDCVQRTVCRGLCAEDWVDMGLRW